MTVTPERRGEAKTPQQDGRGILAKCGRPVRDCCFLHDGKPPCEPMRALRARRGGLMNLLRALDEAESRIAAERERAAQIAESSTDVTTEASARKIATRIREAP